MYYISHGRKIGFYTLRQQFISPLNGMHCDQYLCTLTKDPETALQKALNLGYEVEAPTFSLEDSKRRSNEHMEALRQAQEEEEAKREAEIVVMIKKGLFPFGRHEGQKFDVADNSYIQFMASTRDDLGKALEKQFPDLFISNQVKDLYYGTTGESYKEAVIGIEEFSFLGNYGWVSVVKVMVEKTGEPLVYMGSGSFMVRVGDKATISFKVKSHETYEGKKQTKMLRPKVVS